MFYFSTFILNFFSAFLLGKSINQYFFKDFGTKKLFQNSFRMCVEKTVLYRFSYRYSFICQGTSTRRQRRDLFGFRVKLPVVTTSLTTQR